MNRVLFKILSSRLEHKSTKIDAGHEQTLIVIAGGTGQTLVIQKGGWG